MWLRYEDGCEIEILFSPLPIWRRFLSLYFHVVIHNFFCRNTLFFLSLHFFLSYQFSVVKCHVFCRNNFLSFSSFTRLSLHITSLIQISHRSRSSVTVIIVYHWCPLGDKEKNVSLFPSKGNKPSKENKPHSILWSIKPRHCLVINLMITPSNVRD